MVDQPCFSIVEPIANDDFRKGGFIQARRIENGVLIGIGAKPGVARLRAKRVFVLLRRQPNPIDDIAFDDQ